MNIEEIRELIEVVNSSGIAELELQRGENRIWIKRNSAQTLHEVVIPASSSAPAVAPAVAPPAPPAAPATGADLTDPGLVAVKSPIVGTFYESASPESSPFVKIGDAVSPGTVLCIIESMKLMNEIESEMTGTIAKRLVENGQPVEYGEVLFLVKPV
jgi:acetyl-CoA carboxylase biotin carboxyl carrier protein